MQLTQAIAAASCRPARAAAGPKPRTAPGPPCRRPRPPQRAARAQAAAATQQAEGLAAWLAAAGVDASKQAAAPGAGGLVCTRAVKPGEQLFAVPATAWITADTAAQCDIGQHLQGCACCPGARQRAGARPRSPCAGPLHLPSQLLLLMHAACLACRLEPWLAVALFLLHERAKGGASRWAPYLAALPADSGSPVQWGEEDLAELRGSQALQTAMAYRCVLRALARCAGLPVARCAQLHGGAGLCGGSAPVHAAGSAWLLSTWLPNVWFPCLQGLLPPAVRAAADGAVWSQPSGL